MILSHSEFLIPSREAPLMTHLDPKAPVITSRFTSQNIQAVCTSAVSSDIMWDYSVKVAEPFQSKNMVWQGLKHFWKSSNTLEVQIENPSKRGARFLHLFWITFPSLVALIIFSKGPLSPHQIPAQIAAPLLRLPTMSSPLDHRSLSPTQFLPKGSPLCTSVDCHPVF